MDRYIGLDAHLKSCTFAVMGPSGRRLKEARVDTDGRTLVEFVHGIAGTRHLCMEEGSLSEWLYEVLEPHVNELVVVQPSGERGSKNDSLDAWTRAEEVRVRSFCRRVYKAPDTFRGLREAVRMYDSATHDRVKVKQRLRALFAGRGLHAGSAVYDPGARRDWLKKLPAASRRRASILGDELDHLEDVCEAAENWLAEEAHRVPAVALLSTAPGLGTVRASQIVSHVVTPHRFRTKRQFWSYCGLGIVFRSSSDWSRTDGGHWQRRTTQQNRGLNRECNKALKNVFKGAVQTIITMRDDPLAEGYRALIEQGKKPNLAKLTIARRLAATVLRMWKSEEEYDPEHWKRPIPAH
jgi:transposase